MKDLDVETLDDASPAEIASSLKEAIQEGNVSRSDQLFAALVDRSDGLTVVDSIAHASLRTLTGAAHTHIGLMLLTRLAADADPELLRLPRAGVLYIAEAPDFNLKPTTGPGRLEDLEKALAEVPSGSTSNTSVRGLVEAAEEAGLVEDVLGDALNRGTTTVSCEDVIRTACRIAALSMLADSPAAAKYGWTHCLTLPQAAWALARVFKSSSFHTQAAQSAVTWVTSFRAGLGNGRLETQLELTAVKMDIAEALDHSPQAAAAVAGHAEPREQQRLIRVLASEAAIRNDAHLIKYTRACLDLAAMDPEQERFYYAAAAYLCSLWCKEEPSEAIVEGLAARPGL